MAKIIIVGAGLIGLWTAIQLKLRFPDLEILVFEKRAEYSRKYPLWLSPDAFKGCQKDSGSVIENLIQQLNDAASAWPKRPMGWNS